MSVWSNLEEHFKYNVNTKRDPETRKLVQEGKIKAPQHDSLLTKDYLNYNTPDDSAMTAQIQYEMDFWEKETMYYYIYQGDNMFNFITDKQQELNFNQYSEKVQTASDYIQLSDIAKTVYSAQKVDGGQFFFAKGKSKEFWDAYKARKENLLGKYEEDQQHAVKEVTNLIEYAESVRELKSIKQEIYNCKYLNKATRQPLWDNCDSKIQELLAA